MARKTLLSTAARLNTLMLAIGALILLAIAGLSYREWTQYRRANINATHTRDVLDSVNRLMGGLLDAETGQRGFVLTGPDTGADRRQLETTRPGIFAIGDVRSGSIKRCAAAVGEGAHVVAALHRYLSTLDAAAAVAGRH